MNVKQNRLTIILLSLLILLCVTGKCYWLSRISFDIDGLHKIIMPVEKYMLPNAIIGFDSNDDNEQLYLEVRSILTPKLFLHKSNLDTLLVIQYKAKKIKEFPNYRVIAKNENEEKIVLILTNSK